MILKNNLIYVKIWYNFFTQLLYADSKGVINWNLIKENVHFVSQYSKEMVNRDKSMLKDVILTENKPNKSITLYDKLSEYPEGTYQKFISNCYEKSKQMNENGCNINRRENVIEKEEKIKNIPIVLLFYIDT